MFGYVADFKLNNICLHGRSQEFFWGGDKSFIREQTFSGAIHEHRKHNNFQNPGASASLPPYGRPCLPYTSTSAVWVSVRLYVKLTTRCRAVQPARKVVRLLNYCCRIGASVESSSIPVPRLWGLICYVEAWHKWATALSCITLPDLTSPYLTLSYITWR